MDVGILYREETTRIVRTGTLDEGWKRGRNGRSVLRFVCWRCRDGGKEEDNSGQRP